MRAHVTAVGMAVTAAVVFGMTSVVGATGTVPERTGAGVKLTRIAGQPVRPGVSEVVRLRQTVIVAGRVLGAAGRLRVELQGRAIAAWRTLTSTTVHGGRFALRWHVHSYETELRAVLLRHGRPVARSAEASVLVGPAYVACRPAPSPASLPAGDGWISGGVYEVGGPDPGLDQCLSQASTVTATDANGDQVVSQPLAGGDGYALLLPAGTYELSDGACRGTATVVAGRRTVADTDCNFP